MKTAVRLLTILSLVVPVFAADVPAFGLWTAAELKQRDEALSRKVGPDHSARETLADYGDHRFRFLYRDADGAPEQHDKIVDVVFVQSGEGTLLLGGKMINPKGSSSTGEWLGTGIEGGERHPLAAGDVLHIPATIPHSFLVPKGGHITYVLVKFPGEVRLGSVRGGVGEDRQAITDADAGTADGARVPGFQGGHRRVVDLGDRGERVPRLTR